MVFRSDNQKYSLRVTIDVVILLLLTVPVSLFYIVDFSPFRRGYFCDDDTIRYPFKDSTVTDLMLYVYGTGIPVVIITVTELAQPPTVTETAENAYIYGWRIPLKLQILYTYLIPFLFGAFLTDMSSNLMKYFLGRLRPNFLDACKPDFNCLTANDTHMYVENYTCTNTDFDKNSNDIRLSFPSGHSSFATYTMLYAVVFLHKRWTSAFSVLLKPVLQLFLLLVATYTAVSRIEDNKHHWSDVLGGLFIGALFFAAIVYSFPIYQRTTYCAERDGERRINHCLGQGGS